MRKKESKFMPSVKVSKIERDKTTSYYRATISRLRSVNEKYKRRYIMNKDRRKVEKELNDSLKDLEWLERPPDNRHRVSHVTQKLIESIEESTMSPKTIEYYSSSLRRIFNEFGSMTVDDFVKNKAWKRIRKKMDDSKNRPGTLNKDSTLIKIWVDYCVDENEMDEKHGREIKKSFKRIPDPNKNTAKNTRHVEMEVYDNALIKMRKKKARYYIGFRMLRESHDRISEFLARRVGDIDLDNKCIHIKQQVLHITGKGLIFKGPKSESGWRNVDISHELCDEIREYYKTYRIDPERDKDLFFLTLTDKPLSHKSWYKIFNKAREEYGFPQTTTHGLRSSSITWILSQNLSETELAQASARMGHKRISTTLDCYLSAHTPKSKKISGFFDQHPINNIRKE